MADYRSCTRCGFKGELKNYAALGEDKRYSLCNTCWVETREGKFADIVIPFGETDLQYVSFELSPDDFERVLAFVGDVMGMSPEVAAGVREAKVIPYLQQREKTQLVCQR